MHCVCFSQNNVQSLRSIFRVLHYTCSSVIHEIHPKLDFGDSLSLVYSGSQSLPIQRGFFRHFSSYLSQSSGPPQQWGFPGSPGSPWQRYSQWTSCIKERQYSEPMRVQILASFELYNTSLWSFDTKGCNYKF